MAASGGVAPVVLVEIQTISGQVLYISDAWIVANSLLSGESMVSYRPWLIGETRFTIYRSTTTYTAEFELQNLSGDTVSRDVSKFISANELTGALVWMRIWRADSQIAIFQFVGKLLDPEVSEHSVMCQAEGFGNWSAIKAPPYQIGVSCPLYFGSIECGSTAATPCQQSYGTCTSIERFKGSIDQYSLNGPSLVQVSQPAPAVTYNAGRKF